MKKKSQTKRVVLQKSTIVHLNSYKMCLVYGGISVIETQCYPEDTTDSVPPTYPPCPTESIPPKVDDDNRN